MIAVQIPEKEEPEDNNPVKLEMGLDGYMHLEWKLNRIQIGLGDSIEGVVKFITNLIQIRDMRLSLVKKEVVGTGQNRKVNTQVLYDFEIMDGCPNKSILCLSF